MDYRPLLKAAADRDFGAFEQGLRSALFEKSLEALEDRAAEVTAAISENREPTDLSAVPTSLYMPNLKAVLNEDLLLEAATRKDFKMVAGLISHNTDPAKRKELAEHHAAMFVLQNSRFDRSKFMKACGVDDKE